MDLNLSDSCPFAQAYVERDIGKLIVLIELRVCLDFGSKVSIVLKELEQRCLRLRDLRFFVDVLIRKIGNLKQPGITEDLYRARELQHANIENWFQYKRYLQTGRVRLHTDFDLAEPLRFLQRRNAGLYLLIRVRFPCFLLDQAPIWVHVDSGVRNQLDRADHLPLVRNLLACRLCAKQRETGDQEERC